MPGSYGASLGAGHMAAVAGGAYTQTGQYMSNTPMYITGPGTHTQYGAQAQHPNYAQAYGTAQYAAGAAPVPSGFASQQQAFAHAANTANAAAAGNFAQQQQQQQQRYAGATQIGFAPGSKPPAAYAQRTPSGNVPMQAGGLLASSTGQQPGTRVYYSQ